MQAQKAKDLPTKKKLGTGDSTVNSNRNSHTTSSGSDFSIPNFFGSARPELIPQPLVLVTEQALPVLQAVTRHCRQPVDYLCIAPIITRRATS